LPEAAQPGVVLGQRENLIAAGDLFDPKGVAGLCVPGVERLDDLTHLPGGPGAEDGDDLRQAERRVRREQNGLDYPLRGQLRRRRVLAGRIALAG